MLNICHWGYQEETRMHINKDEELRQIHRKLLITNIIDAPGAILLGFGLYGVFGANGNAFIDILNNQNIVYGAIVVGGAIMAWSLLKMLTLLKRKAEIMSEEKPYKRAQTGRQTAMRFDDR